jgi:nucleoid-associated protein YgaU
VAGESSLVLKPHGHVPAPKPAAAQPSPTPKAKHAAAQPSPTPKAKHAAAQHVHVVRRGETLSGIAKQHHTTWQQLYRDNRSAVGRDPHHLKPGTRLRY